MLPRDPQLVRRVLQIFRPMLSRYFRAAHEGVSRVPDGPCVLVSNHNIAVPWELLAIVSAWEERFEGKRGLYFLTADIWFRLPGLRSVLPRLGCIPATHEVAAEALSGGAGLLVFPGGSREASRPFWRWKQSDLGGRMGWARIAARAKAPLVPISVAGSHLINPVLVQSPLLGWISGVRFLGEKWMPITLGQLLLAAGAGIATAFVAPPWAAALAAYFTLWNPAGAYFPLFPSKIRVKFGEAFPSPAGSEEAALRASYEQVSRAVQAGMDELLVG